MAEKITIAQLDINTDALVKSASELKGTIASLKDEQSKLKKSGAENSEEFVKNEAQLRRLSTEYRNQQSTITQLITSNGQLKTSEEALSIALDKENKTISEARQNNAELTKVRNELNVATPEGAKAIALVNEKIDANNKIIKDNVSQLEQQKISIGDYKTAITDALNSTGLFGGSINTVKESMSKIAPITDLVGKSFQQGASSIKNAGAETQGMSVAQKGLAVATNVGTGAMRVFATAVAATGIGLIIIAMALLIGYFKTFDPLVDKIEQSMAGLGAVVRAVQNTMVSFISNLKSVGDLFSKLGQFMANPIDSMKKLGKTMGEAYDAASKLKEAQQDLADAQLVQNTENLKQEAQIKRLMLQSRDRTKTEAQRIAILEEASALEKANFEQNAKLAEKDYANSIESARLKGDLTKQEVDNLKTKGLAYAVYLMNLGKITQDEVDLIQKSTEAKIDIVNKDTDRQEKIQMKSDALAEKAQQDEEKRQQKAEELRQKRLDNVASSLKAELDLYISVNSKKADTLEEELALAKTISDKKIAIAQADYNASEKTEADKLTMLKAKNDAKDEMVASQLEVVKANAQADLDLFIAQNQSKLDGVKILTQQLLDEEAIRLENVRLEKENMLALELGTNQQLIDTKIAQNEALTNADKEYMASKIVLDDETNRQIQVNKELLDAQIKEQKASQLIADNEIALANTQGQFELETLQAQQNYQTEMDLLREQLTKKMLTQEQFDKLSVIANDKKNQMMNVANLKNTQATLGGLQALGNGMTELFGESKGLAYAMAMLNGAQAITSILAQYPKFDGGFAMGAALVTAGITTAAQMSKISSTKLEDGGIVPIGGKRHSQGGTKFWGEDGTTFEAEAGEGIGVLNRSAFRSFMDFNNSNNGGGKSSPSFMAGGGIITRGVTQPVMNEEVITNNTIQAIKAMPPTIVTVEDINYKFAEANQIEVNSNF